MSGELFLCPCDAWEVESESVSVEIGRFNGLLRLLHIDIAFDTPPSVAQVQRLMVVVVAKLKSGSESVFTVSEIVSNLVRVLVRVDPRSQICAFVLVCLRELVRKYPSLGVLKQAYAACLILTSELPLSFCRHHLVYITEEDAAMVIKYLGSSLYCESLKCLVVSVVIPSARFHTKEYVGGPRDHLFPDPMVMIENDDYFRDEEFLYTAFVVQQAHSIVQFVGSQNPPASLKLFVFLQNFITRDYMSLACLCRALSVHATQPSTVCSAIGFWKYLDSKCGAEMIREMVVTNTSPSYGKMMQILRHHVILVLNKYKDSFSETFINVYSVMGMNLAEAIGTVPKLLDATGEAHVCWAYSLLLRISLERISDANIPILEHFHGILHHFVKVIEYGVINVQLRSVLSNQMVVNTLTLFYQIFNRFKIQTLSGQFMRDTITVLNWLVFVPIVEGSYLAFDLLSLYEAIAETVTSHASLFRRSVEKTISLGDAIGSALVSTLTGVNLDVFAKLAIILIDTSMSSAYEILHNLSLSVVNQSGIATVFNDIFFDCLFSRDEPELRNHRFESYCLIITSLCQKCPQFVAAFMQTTAFYKLCDLARDFFRAGKLKDSLRLVDIFLPLFDQFYSQGILQLPEFDLTPVFASARSLSSPAVDALLRLSLQLISKCEHKELPYGINLAALAAMPCTPELFQNFANELHDRFGCPVPAELPSKPSPVDPQHRRAFPWSRTTPRQFPISSLLSVSLSPQTLSPTQIITVEVDGD